MDIKLLLMETRRRPGQVEAMDISSHHKAQFRTIPGMNISTSVSMSMSIITSITMTRSANMSMNIIMLLIVQILLPVVVTAVEEADIRLHHLEDHLL